MSIRNALLALAVLATTTAAMDDAEAQRRRRGGGTRYVANGTFGAGLELGAPAGLNGKYFLSSDGALNFGIGWIGDYYYRGREGVHLYFDYLWHPLSLANPPAFQLPLYVGVGGRLWSFDDYDRDRRYDGAYAFGVRVPFGIAFDFNDAPLDVFFQLTFVLDFFRGYDDRTRATLEGSAGIRFWFN